MSRGGWARAGRLDVTNGRSERAGLDESEGRAFTKKRGEMTNTFLA